MKMFRDFFAEWFADGGFDEPDEAIFDRAALSDLLPYRVYDPKEHLYINATSTGFVVEVVPQLGNDQVVANLHAAIAGEMPNNAGIQFINWTSPNINAALGQWAAHRRTGDELVEKITQSRLQHISDLRFGSETSRKCIPLKRRVFIAVWIEGDNSLSTISALKSFRKSVLGAFGINNALEANLQPVDLLGLLQEMLHAEQWGDVGNASYTTELPLNQQVPGASIGVTPGYLLLAGEPTLSASVASVAKLPEEWDDRLGLLLFGHPDQIEDRPHGPLLTTLSATVVPKQNAEGNLLTQITKMQHGKKTGLAKFVTDFAGKERELADLSKELSDGTERLYETSLTVVAYAKGTQEAARAAGNEMAKIYRRAGFALRQEKYLNLPMFLGALPMGMTKNHLKTYSKMMRMRLAKGKSVCALAPLQGEFSGNSNGPGMLLLGRQGEVLKWSNFISEGNYNLACVGKSGAGKSVFMQDLITSIYANGGYAMVIDDGYSFKTTCEILGGKHIAFDGSVELKLNPFTMLDAEHMSGDEYRNEAVVLISQVIGSMVSLGQQREGRVEGIEENAIQQAVMRVWDTLGPKGEITDVHQNLIEMSKTDQRLDDVCFKLQAFCRNGAYGQYFTGPSNISIENPFTVFELSDVKTQPVLEQVIMQLIMFLGTELMFKTDRATPVAILIDEAWDMLKGKGTAKFIEGVVRRARKYTGALITGTQSIDDYYDNPAAEVCLQNSDYLVMLAQKAETIDRLQKDKKLSFPDGYATRLKSITSVPGAFSELAIKGPTGWFMARLVLDPFSLAVYSSKGSTVAQLNRRKAKGMSTVEALEDMVASGEVS